MMVGNLEAIGDAVTGAVFGRAMEPKAGEAAEGHSHETHCLNCGADLTGPFCHQCGQHAHVHRTLTAFFHDLAHGVFHLEGKLWNTIPMLAWRPGELTRRYIDGQRARFVSPIALFLFCVFLMFAVMGATGGLDSMAKQASQNDVQSEISDAKERVSDLQEQRTDALSSHRATDKIDAKIKSTQAKIAALQTADAHKIGQNSAIQVSDNMPGWLKDVAGKAAANPELLLFKLKTNAYKFSWALIPISVPFVWLLFPFSRRFKLYDHTVFVTYSLCFMMLLLSAGTLVALISGTLAGMLTFAPPLHMYRQLRGAYGVSAWGAVWRTTVLTIFAFIAIGLFASLLVGVGAFE
jgi:Protein of unknown function (DUF3667)